MSCATCARNALHHSITSDLGPTHLFSPIVTRRAYCLDSSNIGVEVISSSGQYWGKQMYIIQGHLLTVLDILVCVGHRAGYRLPSADIITNPPLLNLELIPSSFYSSI